MKIQHWNYGLLFCLWVLVSLAASPLFGAETNSLLLPLGTIPVQGPVEELEVIHDLHGGMYVLYIAGGEFRVIRGTRDGNFAAYTPEGFDASVGKISRARNLILSDTGPIQFAAYTGSTGGTEQVFLLALDFEGVLKYIPLWDGNSFQSITGYVLTGSQNGGAALFILSGGRLNAITGLGLQDRLVLNQSISLFNEGPDAFEVFYDVWSRQFFGWYGLNRGEEREIILFSLTEGGSPVRQSAGSFSGDVRLNYGRDLDGSISYTLLNGREIIQYRGHAGGFNRVGSFTAPVTVQLYYPPITEDGWGLLTGGTGSEQQVFGVLHTKSAVPIFREWLTIENGSLINMLYTPNGDIFLFYQHEGKLCSLFINGETKREIPIAAAGKDPAVVFITYEETPQIYILNEPRGNRLGIYRFNGESWQVLEQLDLPEAVSGEIYSRSRRINGEILLAVYHDDSIRLYRKGE
jgi:hypothetical protein